MQAALLWRLESFLLPLKKFYFASSLIVVVIIASVMTLAIKYFMPFPFNEMNLFYVTAVAAQLQLFFFISIKNSVSGLFTLGETHIKTILSFSRTAQT